MASYSSFSDHDLLPLIRKGNRDAYAELYGRYYQPIYRSLRKYLRSEELSEDITQNIFLKFWENREQPVIIREPSSWLFTLAKREAFNFLKRASIEEAALGIVLQNYPPAPDTEQQVVTRDYLAFIESTLEQLPSVTSEIFRRCRQRHQTYEEAAEAMGISRSTVKKHMIRAMSVLKDASESELGIFFTIVLAILYSKM